DLLESGATRDVAGEIIVRQRRKTSAAGRDDRAVRILASEIREEIVGRIDLLGLDVGIAEHQDRILFAGWNRSIVEAQGVGRERAEALGGLSIMRVGLEEPAQDRIGDGR